MSLKSKWERADEALLRNEVRNKLTPQQQIKELDIREGVGEGAKKERARLNTLIELSNAHQEKKKKGKKDENIRT